MAMVDTILIIAAIVCFLLEAANVVPRIKIGWVGLALWALSLLV